MRERRRLDANPFLEPVGAQVRAPGPRGNRHAHRIRFGRDAHRVRAIEDDRAQVAGVELVVAHAGLLRGVELVLREGNLHAENLRRTEQPVGVVAQPEDRGAVDRLVRAHALEHAEAIMQRMRENVRRRFAPRHHLAVVPDPAVAVCHRHRVFLRPREISILPDVGAAPRRPRRAEHVGPQRRDRGRAAAPADRDRHARAVRR